MAPKPSGIYNTRPRKSSRKRSGSYDPTPRKSNRRPRMGLPPGSGSPTTTGQLPIRRPQPLIPLELINGNLPPIIPFDTTSGFPGFKYIPIAKGAGDEDKNYDLTRIIVVHPGQPNEPLECSIRVRVIPFHDAFGGPVKPKIPGMKQDNIPMDRYVALSYAWEGQKPTEMIRVRHRDGPLTFLVTANLKSALTTLRHPLEDRTFWADAISMDQSNKEEKSQQLPLMSRIYAEAERVCVWLGEQEESILEVKGSDFTTIKIVVSDAFQVMKKIRRWQKFRTVVEEDTSCNEWHAFIWVMTRPWFSRRWVVQEIVLAAQAELRCGEQVIRWIEFAQAVSLFSELEKNIKALFQRDPHSSHPRDKFGKFSEFPASRLVQVTADIVSRRDDGRVMKRLESLESLISTFAPFIAEDPKDNIYSILSLAKDVKPTTKDVTFKETTVADVPLHNRIGDKALVAINTLSRNAKKDRFPVDYKKDFDEICHDVLVHVSHHSGSLDLIFRPWCPKDKDERVDGCPRRLPTWARQLKDQSWRLSDAGNVERANADPLVGLPGRCPYRASGTLLEPYKFEREDGPSGRYFLSVRGFQLDEITKVEDRSSRGVLSSTWLKYRHPQSAASSRGSPAWDSEVVPKVSNEFWGTMVAGKGPDGQDPPLTYSLLSHDLFDTDEDLNLELEAKETDNELYRDFVNRVTAVIWRRRLARTARHGCLVLLPETAQAGDVICILYRCSVPVVLRATSEVGPAGDPIWEVVGECFVYGMMTGEALVLQQRNEKGDAFYKKQTFTIL